MIVPPTILAEDLKDKFYSLGQTDNIFIKSAIHENKDYSGALINNNQDGKKVVFIDWFNNKCLNVWKNGINALYSQVPFDGLWLDMNEPFTSINGEVNLDPPTPSPTSQVLS